MILNALTKFFKQVANFDFTPEILADMFASKLSRIKK